MRIALIALAGLLPALAAAQDPAPYVVHEGRAVRAAQAAPARQTSAAKQTSAFGTTAIQAGVAPGGSSSAVAGPSGGGARAFRGVGRAFRNRGIAGSTPGTPPPPPSAPAYAVPGAKIIGAGQQPVYSAPGNGGTHSVEGGGFIAIDAARAHDVGRAPGITWAPPDTRPSVNPRSGGGGTGASANGPEVTTSNGPGNSNGLTINANNGNQNGGMDQRDNSATGFNPAF